MGTQPVMSMNPDELDEQGKLRLAMLMSQGGMGQGQSAPPPVVQSGSDPLGGKEEIPTLPGAPPSPNVTLAHASMAAQPAASDVSKAQDNLDAFQNRPMWKKMIGPGIIGAASALGAHSWGGRDLQQQAGQAMHDVVGEEQTRYQSLVNQLDSSRRLQQQQYETDQRNRQQDIMLAGQNQEKTLLGQIAAQSRGGVAQTAADSRRDVATTNAGSRESVAATGATSRETIAGEGNKTKLEVAKINADAAMKRFLAGQNRVDARQDASFAHTDEKPTADEERRADLSEAMVGYAQMMQDIATRRPELFGPMSGRLTQVRNAVGTDDADVAALKMLKEQLGITQMGAHSLRSAQAIAPIADALVNGFHNDAATTIATADRAIKGIEQFINGPERPVVYPAGTNLHNAVGGPRKPLASKVGGTPVTALTVPVGGTYNGHKYLGGPRNLPGSWQAVGGK